MYLTLQGAVLSLPDSDAIVKTSLCVFVIVVALVFNILYMQRVQKVTDRTQLIVIELAVVVWVIGMHGPVFFDASWYRPIVGSILLGAFTALSPFFVK